MPLKALFFDLDDTLLDTHYGSEVALAASCTVVRERCPEVAEEQLREAFWAALVESEERLAQGTYHAPAGGILTIADLYQRRWQAVLERCGAPLTAARELADTYLAHRRASYRLYDDVSERLPPLLPAYQVALITNGLSDFQREKIVAVGLERWIPAIHVSGEIGIWKPQPGIFRHALAALGCHPHEAVMIGDSLRHDIAGAAAIGLRTVWINRHHLPLRDGITPDATITDLHALADLLAGWDAASKAS